MTIADTNDAGDATRALIFALLALACGHMHSGGRTTRFPYCPGCP